MWMDWHTVVANGVAFVLVGAPLVVVSLLARPVLRHRKRARDAAHQAAHTMFDPECWRCRNELTEAQAEGAETRRKEAAERAQLDRVETLRREAARLGVRQPNR